MSQRARRAGDGPATPDARPLAPRFNEAAPWRSTVAARARWAHAKGAAYVRWGFASAAFLACLTPTRLAIACPNCATGREARAQAWAEGLGFNLFVSVLPFAIIGAVSLWADGIGRTPAARGALEGEPEAETLDRAGPRFEDELAARRVDRGR